jgi:23S rRNA (guanosine2251-2'-O)-methyltransferase
VTIEILYGRHAVHEALRAGRRHPYNLTLATSVQESALVRQIVELAQKARCPVKRLDKVQFGRLLPDVNHQGVALEASSYPFAALDDTFALADRREEPPFLLILDHLEDPQNLGTLLRTAEAMGMHGVILPARRAASVTPAVCNASSGAVEHLLIAEVTNISRTQDHLKQRGVWVAGLDDRPEAQVLGKSDLSGPLALVVGSEGKGLSRLVRDKCDWLVRIPMLGQIESLNAAVAGSVVLVAARSAREQRRAQAMAAT